MNVRQAHRNSEVEESPESVRRKRLKTAPATAARAQARLVRAEAAQNGQVAVLLIGYMLLSLLVVATVTGISAVYLETKKLLSAADAASAAAAETANFDGLKQSPQLHLDQESITQAAEGFLAKNQVSTHFDRLTVSPQTGSPDGRSARVVLTAVVHPPIISFLLPDGIQITAESISRPQLYR